MKNAVCRLLFLCAVSITSSLFAQQPSVAITVLRTGQHQIVKQVRSDLAGNFVIGTLPAGNYTLQFRAPKSARLSNQKFSLAVDGVKISGHQEGISGNSLVGGVALDVAVSAGRSVSGHITTGPRVASKSGKKRMVWVPKQIGSNLPARWIEEGSVQTVAAFNSGHISIDKIRQMQDHGDVGH